MCFNAHIWTKSKFYGMSIGVVNQGEGKRVDQKKLIQQETREKKLHDRKTWGIVLK